MSDGNDANDGDRQERPGEAVVDSHAPTEEDKEKAERAPQTETTKATSPLTNIPPPPLHQPRTPTPAEADRRRGDPPPPAPDPTVVNAPPLPPPGWSTANTYVGPPPPPPPAYAPPQPGAPAPAPTPTRARANARLTALLVAMVVVGLGSGLGVWYVGRDHGGGSGTTGASAPPTAVTATTAPDSEPAGTPTPGATPTTPGAPTTSGAPTTPAGYRLTTDPVGYTLAVPEGWTRRQKQGEKAAVVYYDSPSDGRQLQIFELSESTPSESLDLAENDPGYGYAHEPGFQARGSDSGDTWAELSYRYDDEDKGARQVIDHRFQAPDGTLYAIRSSGPEDLPADQIRTPLTTALSSFCPTNASCAA
ncbi:hypothetical protein [Streptomyces sp. L2]|uniref:hypothetical protein n=1 Tax=Streptomyces sp. L2 TaxID=2162665 RepID=UPI0010119450|nr:hypothetical protein [Streptomyces sp. L2]